MEYSTKEFELRWCLHRLLSASKPVSGGNVPRGEFARIVGAIGDVRHQSLDLEPTGEVYFPLAQFNMSFQVIVARTTTDPRALLATVRQAVRDLDATVPIIDLRTMENAVASSLARRQLVLQLLAAFAAIGLALGAIGIYGVVAYAVSQRTREIGVRIALGASRGSIVAMVVRSGMGYTILGVVAGLAGALLLAGTLRSLVYDVSTSDPVTYVTVAVAILAVSALAS